MTLSLIKSPAAVNPVGNDIEFKIHTNNRFSTIGTEGLIGLKWTAGDSAGDTFKLSWKNNEVVFTCADTPDDSGLQYKAYVSGSVDDWMESLVDDFKANYLISENYNIVWIPSQSNIQFISKKIGSEWVITLSDITGSNVTNYISSGGADSVLRDFYKIIARIWQKDTVNILLGEDRLTPDSYGYVSFKIQEYFENLFDFSFEWPEGSTNFLFKKTDRIARFFVEYAETYDNVVKKLFSTEETETHVILAGIDKIKTAQLNEENKSWWDSFLYKKDFLTYQPREMYVGLKQPVKLNFLVWADVTSIKLVVKIYFNDNTGNQIIKTFAASQFDIVECVLSPLKLLSAFSNIDYYEVYITDQNDNRISISRYFHIDDSYRENERTFIFKNSLGGPDVLRFVGISEVNTELQRNSFERLNTEGFTWKNFESQDFDISEIQKFKFNTGWMDDLSPTPAALADYLREFYLSDQVYELINNRLYPIKLTSKKALIGRSDETLISFEFEAERAYSDKYYGRDENIHPVTGFDSKFIEDEFLNP